MRYYFPTHDLLPGFESGLSAEPFQLVRRRWTVSTFDLATLATKHRLHIPYQLMDVQLQESHFEISVEADTLDTARQLARRLRIMLYLEGVTPFLMPFVTSHSYNEYGGINARDSSLNVPEGMEGMPTSKEVTVEAWPGDGVLGTFRTGLNLVTEDNFHRAAETACEWGGMARKNASLLALEEGVGTAPLIPNIGQSILHMWTTLESLFPNVMAEVSFRLALYITQMNSANDRPDYFRMVKRAYGIRSAVAHGSTAKATPAAWDETWGILLDTCRAVVTRGVLPTENELLGELLADQRI